MTMDGTAKREEAMQDREPTVEIHDYETIRNSFAASSLSA